MQTQTASSELMALAHASGRKPKRLEADENMPARFYMDAAQDTEASKKAGRPIFNSVPFIEIYTPGDKDNIIRRKVWDEPGVENCDTERWPRQWASFKAGLEQSAPGTPLRQLPGITEAQAQELAFFHIQTVEHLAMMADEKASQAMGFVELKQRAKDWIDTARGAAPVQELRGRLEEERLKRESAEARLAAIEARLAEEPRRGPGRPPKQVE